MEKIYRKTSSLFVLLFLFATVEKASGQDFRTSPFQYQYNQLSLNPAFASRLPYPGFEALYFGNFSSPGEVSRSAFLHVQGPTAGGGLGGSLQFFRTFSFGELNLRPAYARSFFLPNGGEISFGANLGLNYFDIDELVATNLQSDFFSLDGGAGVFYHQEKFFAGLSILKIFETPFGHGGQNNGPGLLRENPFNLHAGWAFRLLDDVEIMPRALLRFINLYELPSEPSGSLGQDVSFDFQLGAIVQDMYVINLLYGETDRELGAGLRRMGISATYLLGHFRLSYAFQLNSQKSNSVSFPVTHLIGAGFDLVPEGDVPPRKYF